MKFYVKLFFENILNIIVFSVLIYFKMVNLICDASIKDVI